MLCSINELERLLEVPRQELRELARLAPSLYSRFYQRKPGKKPRPIDNPNARLKKTQRRILDRLIPKQPIDEMHGGIPKHSTITMAESHLGKSEVVTIDLRDCFGSITHKQVFAALRTLGLSSSIASLITQIATLDGTLPQGAPTSLALANLVLAPAFREIVARANAANAKATFYVDDIAISGDNVRVLIPDVCQILARHQHPVSRKKIRIMGRGGAKQVTGVGVAGGSPTVPRGLRNDIRAAIKKASALRPLDERTRSVLVGKIAYANRVNANQGASLSAYACRHLGPDWAKQSPTA